MAGVVALVTSFIVSSGVLAAPIMGAGVLGGFYAGFTSLFFLWVFLGRQE